ncbi:hypothetical protein JCM7447_07910 [Corynebacterium amycolatum]
MVHVHLGEQWSILSTGLWTCGESTQFATTPATPKHNIEVTGRRKAKMGMKKPARNNRTG